MFWYTPEKHQEICHMWVALRLLVHSGVSWTHKKKYILSCYTLLDADVWHSYSRMKCKQTGYAQGVSDYNVMDERLDGFYFIL